jgi:hypothetical protein
MDRNKQDIKCNQRAFKPANCDARPREGQTDSLIPTSTVNRLRYKLIGRAVHLSPMAVRSRAARIRSGCV